MGTINLSQETEALAERLAEAQSLGFSFPERDHGRPQFPMIVVDSSALDGDDAGASKLQLSPIQWTEDGWPEFEPYPP